MTHASARTTRSPRLREQRLYHSLRGGKAFSFTGSGIRHPGSGLSRPDGEIEPHVRGEAFSLTGWLTGLAIWRCKTSRTKNDSSPASCMRHRHTAPAGAFWVAQCEPYSASPGFAVRFFLYCIIVPDATGRKAREMNSSCALFPRARPSTGGPGLPNAAPSGARTGPVFATIQPHDKPFGHSGFVMVSSFGFRHSDFHPPVRRHRFRQQGPHRHSAPGRGVWGRILCDSPISL